MEENSVTSKSISLKYGLISGLIGVTFFIVQNLLGQGMNQALSYVGLLILAIIIYLAQKAFKDEGDGYMAYSKGLGIGTLLSLVSSVIGSVFMFIYVSYINDGYIQQLVDKARRDMEDQGQSDEIIDQSMEFMSMIFSPIALPIMGIISTVFFGFLISLIVSAINQNKPPENDLLWAKISR